MGTKLEQRPVTCCWEHGNEHLASITLTRIPQVSHQLSLTKTAHSIH